MEALDLAAALEGGQLPLQQVIERAMESNAAQQRLLLVIDQFEELYTLCPEPARRQRFLDCLLPATEATGGGADPPFGLMLVLRADYVGQALAHRRFADLLQNASLMLGPMGRQELSAVIQKPAEVQGAAFEPGLVDRILDDVSEEPGNLPLLEFALTLLWDRSTTGWLTHRDYEEIGRVGGALAGHAEQVFGKLGPVEQTRVPQVLTQLVQPGEGMEDSRRVATRAELGEADWPVAQRLADDRLVVTSRDTEGNEIAEVAHEALIQHWERLQRWLAANRAFRIWQEGLRAALRQWEASAGDEGALLRGVPLAQAQEWLAAREVDLSPAEQAFIRASLALRERRAAAREAQRQRELASERRSRRLWVALAGVLAAATVVALVLTFFAVQQRRQALEAYSLSLAANAREALNDLDTATGLLLAQAANQIENPPLDAQRLLVEAAYGPGARWRGEVAELFPGAEGPVTALDISPDGQTALCGLADGGIVLWDLETKEEVARLRGHSASVNDIVFGPQGSMALSGGEDAQVILWDLGAGQEIRRFGGHTGTVRAVDISPDGRTAVSGGFAGIAWMQPGELILWDLETGQELRRLEGHVAGIVAAEFTPAGDSLLVSSGDAEIFSDKLPEGGVVDSDDLPFDLVLWDVTTGEVRRRFEASDDDVYDLSISSDGTKALTGSCYTNVSTLWDLETGERVFALEDHHEGVIAVAYGPDGGRALSGSYDDSLVLWDLQTGQPVARLDAHGSDVLDLVFSSDGRMALSSSGDGGLILWDLVHAAELQRLSGHGDAVWDVAFTPDGRMALSSSGTPGPSIPVQEASIRLWDLETGAQLQAFELAVDVVFQVAISPDGRTALVATNEPFVRVWDLHSWQEVGRLEGHAAGVPGIEFTPDGQRAVSASVDGTVILWDVPARHALFRVGGHGKGLWSVAVSPDGRTALSDSGDSSMVLWDLETGAEIRSFMRQDSPEGVGSSGLAFLPDGHRAISCEDDGTLIEWDLETGEEVRRLGEHPALRTRVVVSPDGRLALTSGMDGALMLWDLESNALIRRSDGHGVIFDLALSPDGQTVLFGSANRTIVQRRVTDPSPEDLKDWITANRYLREPTCAERETYQLEPFCEASQ
jgi:WD40 repeat protein